VSTIGTRVIDCQVCIRVNGKTSVHLKSVFKMSTLCSKSIGSSKTWTPLPDCFIDDHLVDMFPLVDQTRLQLDDVTNLAAVVHTILAAASPNLVVDWVKVRTVGWPQSWSGEVWCYLNRCTVSRALWAGRLSAWLQYVTLYWKLKFCRQYLNINHSCNK